MQLEEIIINLRNIFSTQLLIKIGIKFLQLLGILIAMKLLFKVGDILINKLLDETGDDRKKNQRNKTLKGILKSGLKYLLYFIGGTMILEMMGIPTASVLAGAGVIGLAIGFGAQELVQDIITGFFILFEDQFGIGDYVKLSGVEGVVKEIGLRMTVLESFDGDYHLIPNGNIGQVTNFTKEKKRVVVDAPIDYDQNIGEAVEVLNDLCQEIKEEYEDILIEEPKVLGVQDLAASSVNIRIAAMVVPMEVWKMERIFRRRIKEVFDEAEINIPYNHLTIVNKQAD